MVLNSSLFPADAVWGVVSLNDPVAPHAAEQYRQWLAEGRHGDMKYLENYLELRSDPRALLPEAKSMICVALPYYTDEPFHLPVSLYARGRDYHEVVREKLQAIADTLPGATRVCVDTAPLRERYWAARAGLGFIGKNNQLIIPGKGSYFFLGFILWRGGVTASPTPPHHNCGSCRRCIDACPGHCIPEDGSGIDARRCLSYLTIEYRGELTEKIPTLYGCDMCQRVCPHNAMVQPTSIEDFHPLEEFATMTEADVAALTSGAFRRFFRHSAIRRTRLSGLLRNLSALKR